ncbi:hypothetical protein [Corallococcus macrosporus]|uniref:Uncharacterized protein n=1 Tax=Myxococcus fulvus (strain ATCC BAA-855 / HW-1) TaxID=483219 RepID=F8C6A1_MYXFH|nr:hypothetical protein [Corallococcus macrosporus]AEI64289.1 hypothetical protein LILAB_11900 [Corallococcus macrosporus]
MNGNGREEGVPSAIERHEDHRITRGMGDRKQVEETADRIRDELLLTLAELDRRRERALDVRYHAMQHRDELMTAGAALLTVVGLGVGYAVYRARHRDEILRRKRRKALARAWEHPDRVASTAEQRPLGAELGRKLVLIFASALATAVARNAVVTLVPARKAPSSSVGVDKNT